MKARYWPCFSVNVVISRVRPNSRDSRKMMSTKALVVTRSPGRRCGYSRRNLMMRDYVARTKRLTCVSSRPDMPHAIAPLHRREGRQTIATIPLFRDYPRRGSHGVAAPLSSRFQFRNPFSLFDARCWLCRPQESPANARCAVGFPRWPGVLAGHRAGRAITDSATVTSSTLCGSVLREPME